MLFFLEYCSKKCRIKYCVKEISKAKTGKIRSEQEIKSISIGTKKAMWNPKVRAKYLKSLKNRKSAHSVKSDLKRSKSMKGKNSKLNQIRKCACGCGQTFECKPGSKKRYVKRGNYSHTDSAKSKIKKSAIKRIESNNGYTPSYNKKAVLIFQEFKKTNNLKNCYFATEPNEWHVKETTYSLDFIDFDIKLIIEVDEGHHFEESGELRKYDIKRQEEIQAHFLDFKFLRFKDTEMHKILLLKILK